MLVIFNGHGRRSRNFKIAFFTQRQLTVPVSIRLTFLFQPPRLSAKYSAYGIDCFVPARLSSFTSMFIYRNFIFTVFTLLNAYPINVIISYFELVEQYLFQIFFKACFVFKLLGQGFHHIGNCS